MDNYVDSSSPWLVVLKKNPQAALRLFCFHYGGGSASAYRSWVDMLPSTIELVAVQLPGREGRFKERFITKVPELVNYLMQALSPFLDKPYVVFGHSLGAINSFEWLREVKRQSLRAPLLFIPSGMPAPQYQYDEPPISQLPEEEFVKALLKDYGNTLRTTLEHKELRDVFMPQLRGDFGLLESYQYEEGVRLDGPILAFAGEEEPEIGDKELSGWATQTHASFYSKRFIGDHFFIHSSESDVLDTISTELNKLTTIIQAENNCSFP